MADYIVTVRFLVDIDPEKIDPGQIYLEIPDYEFFQFTDGGDGCAEILEHETLSALPVGDEDEDEEDY